MACEPCALTAAPAALRALPARRNIVYMGMGEPMHNLAAVLPSIEIMTHPLGLHLSAYKVGVSLLRRWLPTWLPGLSSQGQCCLCRDCLAQLQP